MRRAEVPHAALAGFSIGILVLDTKHELVRGNIQHAGSFEFPVLYEVVKGVSGAELMAGDAAAVHAIAACAQRLEQAGVDAIVGACGSFANYQTEIAAQVKVPVFISILLQVPLLLRSLSPAHKLGIIFARAASFTDKVRNACGIDQTDRIVAVGADSIEAFQPILTQKAALNSEALGRGLVGLAERTQREHPSIATWLLQCSDLPPYAALLQQATQRPVFDMLTLIRHVHDACNRRTLVDL